MTKEDAHERKSGFNDQELRCYACNTILDPNNEAMTRTPTQRFVSEVLKSNEYTKEQKEFAKTFLGKPLCKPCLLAYNQELGIPENAWFTTNISWFRLQLILSHKKEQEQKKAASINVKQTFKQHQRIMMMKKKVSKD